MLRSMWDLPRPELETVSSALAGGFLTTAPPGKPSSLCFVRFFFFFPMNLTSIHLVTGPVDYLSDKCNCTTHLTFILISGIIDITIFPKETNLNAVLYFNKQGIKFLNVIFSELLPDFVRFFLTLFWRSNKN